MKISNEFKVGVIAVVSIVMLVLGFNFLKGKKLFSKSTTLFGTYTDVKGLQNSNPVIINGLQVGTVYKISTDKDMRRIKVELNITKDINIPENSVALIESNPIGTTSILIELGNATKNLATGDTIYTETSPGMFKDILKKVDPVLYQVTKAVEHLDTMIRSFTTIMDPSAKNNIAASLANLNNITTSMAYSSRSLQALLNERTGALARSMENVSQITGNLVKNNDKVNATMTNFQTASEKLAQLEIQKTINTLDATVNDLNGMVKKLNTKDGTLGKLLNDPTMYQNLASSGNKLNLLLDDIRLHPKRYINISVFGKKNTVNEPLRVPLPDTINSPYYIETLNEPIIK